MADVCEDQGSTFRLEKGDTSFSEGISLCDDPNVGLDRSAVAIQSIQLVVPRLIHMGLVRVPPSLYTTQASQDAKGGSEGSISVVNEYVGTGEIIEVFTKS